MHTPCLFCGEDPNKRGRLYINIDSEAQIPGLFMCHRCGEKGSLTTLKRFFGDPVSEKEVDTESIGQVLEAAAVYYHDQLVDYEDVYSYLKGSKRGLTGDSIVKHKIGYAPMDIDLDVTTGEYTVKRSTRLFAHLRGLGFKSKEIKDSGLVVETNGRLIDSLSGMITIPYLVAGNVVMIRGRSWPYDGDADIDPDDDPKGEFRKDWADWSLPKYTPPKMKYKTCGGASSRLFNSDVTWQNEELFVTEGEFDAIVMEQQGYPTIGVSGSNAWQDAWDGYLAQAKRVFLIYDRDKSGEEGAKKMVQRFGTRIRRVHLSEQGTKCDPTMFFYEHTKVDFEKLLAEARKGGLLVTVADAIEEFNRKQALPGLKFNHEMLDLMLEPGIQPGQLAVLLAKTGTGKTITLLNWMHRMRMYPGQSNKKFLFISLEQTRGEWWDRARRIYRFYHPHETDDRAAAEWWTDNILIVDKNRLKMEDFRTSIDDFVYRMGDLPDAVFLDYIGYFARNFRGEAYERTSNAVMELKGWAKEAECPLFAPHQVSRKGADGEEFSADAARDSGVIEETADFLFTLWTPDNSLGRNEEEKTGRLHQRIAKSRHGGKGQLLELQFAPLSLAMVPDGDKMAVAARREYNWRRNYRDNWDTAAYRHRTGAHEGVIDLTGKQIIQESFIK